MNDEASGESLKERELRARIIVGSAVIDDYLDLADLLKSASRFEEATDTYEEGLQQPHLTNVTTIEMIGAGFVIYGAHLLNTPQPTPARVPLADVLR